MRGLRLAWSIISRLRGVRGAIRWWVAWGRIRVDILSLIMRVRCWRVLGAWGVGALEAGLVDVTYGSRRESLLPLLRERGGVVG